ncbi:MAG: DUF167 domain-containing protein [Solirubrobacteraceae bacterium]
MSSARIAVRLQPRASRDELVEIRDGVLIARVTAPALEGRANRALCRMLAERLDVAPSRVVLARGERSRQKLIEIDGIEQAELGPRLGL